MTSPNTHNINDLFCVLSKSPGEITSGKRDLYLLDFIFFPPFFPQRTFPKFPERAKLSSGVIMFDDGSFSCPVLTVVLAAGWPTAASTVGLGK